jgi:putative transposase
LIRNSFRFASRKSWDELSRDLKPIYTAVNAEAAAAALDDLHAKWRTRYPAIIRLWRNAWEEFIPFLDYGGRRRLPPQRASVGSLAGCGRGLAESAGAGGALRVSLWGLIGESS